VFVTKNLGLIRIGIHPKPKPMILETNRLILRPIAKDDALEMFGYRSDKETNKYQGWIPETVEDVEVFIGKIAREINQPETWFQFVIIEKLNSTIIGDLGIHFFDTENKQVELGCTLKKDSQRKAYATEALGRVIDFVFTDLKKHRIIASIDPANTSSLRLLNRLGFRQEAHFVESLFIQGKWVDDVRFAMLESEWQKLQKFCKEDIS
jgi:RimJ/RimL family protein N-acetyltransferase